MLLASPSLSSILEKIFGLENDIFDLLAEYEVKKVSLTLSGCHGSLESPAVIGRRRMRSRIVEAHGGPCCVVFKCFLFQSLKGEQAGGKDGCS